jgi:membrane-bound inhibitor of C-type lysozyme
MHPCPPYLAALLGAALAVPAAATSIVVPMHLIVVAPGQRLDGIAFPAGTRAWILDATGEVAHAELRQDFRFGGYRLKKGSDLGLYKGRLVNLTTARGQVINGIRFDAGAQMGFDERGRLTSASLEHDTPIGRYVFARDTWLEFHPSGRVASGALARPAFSDGLRIAAGEIAFHPSGRLADARLETGSIWHGLALQEGAAHFRADGSLERAILAEPATIDGIACERGELALFANGRLDLCRGMPDPARIAYACADGKTLYTQTWAGRSVAFDVPGSQHRLGRVASRGGERYADDTYEWQPPGDGDSTGTLRERAGGKIAFGDCRIGPGGGHW